MINLGPLDLLVPLVMIFVTIVYIPITISRLLLTFNISRLTSWESFQQTWFEHAWAFLEWATSPLFAPDIEAILSNAYGTVVDVGPGAGDTLYLYSPSRNKRVNQVILLEPNTNFHPELKRQAEKVGLTGKYRIIGAPAIEAGDHGIESESVDTIVCVHVLCSVPEPKNNMKHLYTRLKSGGQWLVYEHVRNGDPFAETWQGLVNKIWPFFLDGCSLQRDTGHVLRHELGPWDAVDLHGGSGEGRFSQLPHAAGQLIKR